MKIIKMINSMDDIQKKEDFEKRKRQALSEMDAILNKYEIGIGLALSGYPHAIAPVIGYSDKKIYDEDLNRKDRRTKAAKARRK